VLKLDMVMEFQIVALVVIKNLLMVCKVVKNMMVMVTMVIFKTTFV
jgi:hypothetical protein